MKLEALKPAADLGDIILRVGKRMIRSAEDLMAGIALQHRLHGRPLL